MGHGLPLEDQALIARGPGVILPQSVLEQYYEERAPQEIENIPHQDGPARRGSGSIPLTAGRRLRSSTVKSRRGRRVFDRFSQTDPRWVSSVIAQGLRLFGRKHAFKDNRAPPVALDDRP